MVFVKMVVVVMCGVGVIFVVVVFRVRCWLRKSVVLVMVDVVM